MTTSEANQLTEHDNLASIWSPALLWHPHFAGSADNTPIIPALFWLVSRLRPRRVVALNIGDGAALFAICQAMDRDGGARPGARVAAFGQWTDPATDRAMTAPPDRLRHHAEQNYPTMLRLVVGDGPAPTSDRPDLMLVTVQQTDTPAQLDGWRAGLAPDGLLIVIGADTMPVGGLRLDIGPGLVLLGAGDALPDAVADLDAGARDGQAADAVNWLFQRLGEAVDSARRATASERRLTSLTQKNRTTNKELTDLRRSWDARGLALARAQAALYAAENPHARLAELAGALDAAMAEKERAVALADQEKNARFFETAALTAELERMTAQLAPEGEAAQAAKRLSEAENAKLVAEITTLKSQLSQQKQALDAYKKEVLASTSWRLTGPVRAVGKMLKRR